MSEKTKKAKNTTELIPLSLIDADEEFNARSDIGDLEDILSSIEADGVNHTPCDVRRGKDGRYFLVAGFRRFACLQEIEASHMLCTVYPQNTPKKQILLWNLQENVVRRDLNPMDEARRCQELLENDLLKEELCAALAWTPTKLTQRLKLLELSGTIQEAVQDNVLSIRQAHEINRLPDELQDDYINRAPGMTVASLSDCVSNELGVTPESVAEAQDEGSEVPSEPEGDSSDEGSEEGSDESEAEESGDDGEDLSQMSENIQVFLKDLIAYTYQDSETDEKNTQITKAKFTIDSIDWTTLASSDMDAFVGLLEKIVDGLECGGMSEEA